MSKYPARERKWVRDILAKLTPEQRVALTRRNAGMSPRHRNGKLYDVARARVAERILYQDHMAKQRSAR